MNHQNQKSYTESSSQLLLLKTNLNKAAHNKGCIKRVNVKVCINDHELTLIPIDVDQNMKQWPDSFGIVAIGTDHASKGISLGVKYQGHDTDDEMWDDDDEQLTEINKPCPIITETNIFNANLINVQHIRPYIQRIKLKICRRRLIMECDRSYKNDQLPLIPVCNQNMREWSDYLGIVDIASKGIYLGVKYGYNDSKLSEISQGLAINKLPDDVIRIIVEFTMEFTIKEFILDPLEFTNIIDHYYIDITKYNEWNINKRKYHKWVTNIEINDFDEDMQQFIDANELNEIEGFEADKMRECFADNGVNYRYFQDHSRPEFVQLLRSNPCKVSYGKCCKMYDQFSQIKEIVISALHELSE